MSYFCYWGKASKDDSSYHLLPYHSLDVAAVASVWWDSSPPIQKSFMQYAGELSTVQMRAWVIFFIALHDYGKFDIRFQCKAVKAWAALQPDLVNTALSLPTIEACKTYDHGSAGLYWFERDRTAGDDSSGDFDWMMHIVELVEVVDDSKQAWMAWVKPVTGHHGFVYAIDHPVPERSLRSDVAIQMAEQDKAARLAWLGELERLFLQPAGLSLDNTPPPPSPLLAGFCSVADWLGSRSDEENFCYQAQEVADLQVYFEQKYREDAPRVLALAGINGKPKPFLGMQSLLKQDYQPRQLQTLVNDLPVTSGLTIVEAPTGSGKTEMALAYAWRLLADNHVDSIVFAMPTQATANAMLQRLEKLATKLFEDKPNLILAHGHARFNDNFLKIKQSGKTVQENEEAWVQCNEWLGQSRKRIFLGQIGICTVDQVLVSVLPVKHRFVRGFGVGRSVLIVDEVHAYDAYMYGLLEAVLRVQHEAGGSSILLSATLPQALKNQLLATYGGDAVLDASPSPYPLISWSNGKAIQSFVPSEDEQPPLRQVQIECHKSESLLPDVALIQRIIAAAEQGAQVAIICNLVDVAQQLARQLQGQTSIPVDIFHARYCLHDRQQKEQTVLSHYGAEGQRVTGRILVATQVIEQSLDVDFDWLITQLCPVDLLFQRMGRLHRHERSRPTGFESARCTVLLPVGNDYGTHGLIYGNTRVMWRTAQKLQTCPDQIIAFPAAYRDWIEPVYNEDAWGSEPEAVEAGFALFEEKLAEKRILARQMLKWAKDVALHDTDEQIRAVTRDGEFNLSVIPYLQTASSKQLLDSSILESLNEWQQAEALAMNTVGVPKSWGKLLPKSDEEGRIWLAMQRDGECWKASSKDIWFTYHPVWGMEKSA
ncbi:CRISPR-associated helicase/endonuclease Cas3 [uncultured Thiothrix sp.]|uniref:CRISPR-associated helicase/endonuclease Cas3 n=1 Tax=uncultured Thiothrix sp. TaxID=223185 RepID=UPI0026310981|nr:CRISPR-associated helicase/endonuclease Cas3 [uncultured Thiothrix sp.]HMT92536.1 CRISPR-associated helicase/endonuclease Cas3 [Thiolinea sp.]